MKMLTNKEKCKKCWASKSIFLIGEHCVIANKKCNGIETMKEYNKYQEALEELYGELSFKAECGFGTSECITKPLKETLQELVEKATPKKPKKHITPYNYIEFECPNCNTVTHTNFIRPYCGECGQALDWGEEQ